MAGTFQGGVSLSPPDGVGWSWVNQQSALETLTAYSAWLYETAPSNAQVRARVKSLPAASNYAVTFCIHPNMGVNWDALAGLMLRESSTGKFLTFGLSAVAGTSMMHLEVKKWTNVTSLVNYFSSQGRVYGPRVWFRAEDDGTDLVFSLSYDGEHFVESYRAARLDFLLGGADQYGYFIYPNTGGGMGVAVLDVQVES